MLSLPLKYQYQRTDYRSEHKEGVHVILNNLFIQITTLLVVSRSEKVTKHLSMIHYHIILPQNIKPYGQF